ncbi:MAG TPA: hypothetical protein VIB39_11390 [Candidatus Angelobacter sp.]|jgi:hypothetical protein
MANDEYIKALEKAVADLEDRVNKRDILNAEIAGLKETVRVLSSRVILNKDKATRIVQLLAMAEYATPNLKDAIRTALIRANKPLTAVEMRNALEESGFNFDDFSNPLSACHATLKRMAIDEEVQTDNKDGKTAYYIEIKIAKPGEWPPLGGVIGMASPFFGALEPPNKGRGLMAGPTGEFKAEDFMPTEESRTDRLVRIAKQKREQLKKR